MQPELLKALSSNNPTERAFAIDCLVAARAIPELIDALCVSSEQVRGGAVEALRRIAPDADAAGVIFKGDVIDAFAAILNIPCGDEFWQVVSACVLKRIGGARAAEIFQRVLVHENPLLRQIAIYAMMELAPVHVADLLETDDRVWLRVSLVQALGKTDEMGVLPHMSNALRDTNADVRAAGVATLYHFPFETVSDMLSDALADENPSVRKAALVALGAFEGHAGLERMVQHLCRETDGDVLLAGVERICGLPDDGLVYYFTQVSFLPELSWEVSDFYKHLLQSVGCDICVQMIHHMRCIGKRLFKELVEKLKAPAEERDINKECVFGFGREFNQGLMDLFEDSRKPVRLAAFDAIGDLFEGHTIHGFREFVKGVRGTPCSPLGWGYFAQIGRSVDKLVPLLEDPDVDIWFRVGKILEKLGWVPETEAQKIRFSICNLEDGMAPLDIDLVVRMLVEGNHDVRMWAVDALGTAVEKRSLKNEEKQQAMESLYRTFKEDDSDEVQESAARNLERIGWYPKTPGEHFWKAIAHHMIYGYLWDSETRSQITDIGKRLVLKMLFDRGELWRLTEKTCGLFQDLKPRTIVEKVRIGVIKNTWTEVIALGEEAVPHLIQVLDSLSHYPGLPQSNSFVAARVQGIGNALSRIGEPALDLMRTRLASGDYSFVARLVVGLKGMSSQKTADALIASLAYVMHAMAQHPDEAHLVTLGRNLIEMLGEIGHKTAVPDLISVLENGNPDLRQAAVLALGKLNAPCAVKPLIHMLLNENENLRWAVARALCQFDPPVTAPLIVALCDISASVWAEAAKAWDKPIYAPELPPTRTLSLDKPPPREP